MNWQFLSSDLYEPAVILPYAVTSDEYFLRNGKVTLICDDKEAKIYYTTDGSRPDEESMLYTKPLIIEKTTELRFAAFRDRLLPSVPVSIKLSKLEFENFQNYEGEGAFVKGLNYKYYHAHVLDVDSLDPLTPLETGIISRFRIDQRKREDYFGYNYSGYLNIPEDGIYTFSIKVNDKSTLYLDGKEFLRGGFKTIALRKGKYQILEKYFQLGAKKFNIVSWKAPGIELQEIPETALFHIEN